MRELFHQQEDNDTRTILLVLAVVLLLVAALGVYLAMYDEAAAPASTHSVSSIQQGNLAAVVAVKPAPDLRLKDLAGNEVTLSSYKGKVVVLNFWATWCGPCNIEMPWLVELHEQYHNQGFEIIGISVDSLGEYDPAEVSKFITKHKVGYPIVMATKEIVGAFEPPVTGLPTTLVIDRQGVIRHQHRGLISFDDLKEKVVKLL